MTVCCAEGAEGRNVRRTDSICDRSRVDSSVCPDACEVMMLIVGDPGQERSNCRASRTPAWGWRAQEFIITNQIGIHPMALAQCSASQDPQDVRDRAPDRIEAPRGSSSGASAEASPASRRTLSQAGDSPHERLQDEQCAQLLGGENSKLDEENPMIGFRGASRYYDARYARWVRAGVRRGAAGSRRTQG